MQAYAEGNTSSEDETKTLDAAARIFPTLCDRTSRIQAHAPRLPNIESRNTYDYVRDYYDQRAQPECGMQGSGSVPEHHHVPRSVSCYPVLNQYARCGSFRSRQTGDPVTPPPISRQEHTACFLDSWCTYRDGRSAAGNYILSEHILQTERLMSAVPSSPSSDLSKSMSFHPYKEVPSYLDEDTGGFTAGLTNSGQESGILGQHCRRL